MFKKYLRFIASLFACVILFTSCSHSKYSWNNVMDDVNLLNENNYSVYLENTSENKEYANKEFASWGLDITVTNIIGCAKNDSSIIYFEEFESEKQAKDLYEYQLSTLGEDRSVKFCLKGDILISSNVDEAISLLGYNFI